MRQETISLEERVVIFSKTYNSISLYFAHWEDATYSQHQLDEVYQDYSHRVVSTENRFHFTLLMKEFVARLRNAHSWYIDKHISRAVLPVGVTMRLVEEEWLVHHSIVSELSPGDVIEEIAHRSVEEWRSLCDKYVRAKNEVARQAEFQTVMPWLIEEEVIHIVATGQIGEVKEVIIDRNQLPVGYGLETRGTYIAEVDAGYIWVPSFNDSKFEKAALALYDAYKNAKAIIVDVRDNGGGSTPIDLMQTLLNVPWKWWTERASHPNWMYQRHGSLAQISIVDDGAYTEFVSEIEPPRPESYQGRVIVLTDRYTHSAAEDFTMAFKASGRAVVIGERTAGSTGMPFMHTFDDDKHLAIGSIRSYLPGGTAFEGIGIEPDIYVTKTKRDYIDNRDPILDKALEVISQLS